MRIYLTGSDADYIALNRVYHRNFNDDGKMPGRTTVGVPKQGRGAIVEIDLVVSKH